MPVVHAITIHHRGRQMLADCLTSLLASDGVDLEVVVVANACAEDLPDVVDASPRVHAVRSATSLGFSAANNLGVGWAVANLGQADYYYFVNNDTVSRPDALAWLVDAIEGEPDAAVAGPQLLIEWAPDHLNSLGLNLTEDGWGWDEGIGIPLDDYGPLPGRRQVLAATGSALLMAAGVFHSLGGWTELYDYYFEDVDLCLKAHQAGWTVVVEPRAVVLHHVSATMTLESEHKLFLFWRNRLLLTVIHWPAGRLLKVLKRVVVDEILRRPRRSSELQRRALAGAWAKLPAALAARRRRRATSRRWLGLLRPAGSVPVITLPEKRTGGDLQAEAAAAPPVPAATWSRAASLEPPAPGCRTVLLLGWSPLPFEDARMNYAPGARTWQLAAPLAADGHRVVAACARIPGACADGQEPVSVLERGDVLVYTMERELFDQEGVLEGLLAALRPAVVVGAAAVPSLRATQIAGDLPVWVDLFGDPMAEAQARALVHGQGDQLGAYRDLLVAVLERGDAFSAVSDRQRFAVLGQLGMSGRLNRLTAGVELVHTVPCAVVERERGAREPLPRGCDFADDDFVLLWSGGYNTWCDVDTLAAALELVMAAEPRVRFVSTGGGIPGHDDATYQRWQHLVASSRFGERCSLLGCLPEPEAAALRARADLGIVTERPLAERTLGSSGRVLAWLAVGLPFVCSTASELGEQVAAEDLGLTFAPGDASKLARLVLEAVADPDKVRRMAERARDYARQRWSATRTTEPLRRWVAQAERAPDHDLANPISIMAHAELEADNRRLRERCAHLEQRAADYEARYHDFEARYHQVRSELGEIHLSTMWWLWMRYFALRRALTWPLRALRGAGKDAD